MDSKHSVFFIVIPLGFEDVAQAEVVNCLQNLGSPIPRIEIKKGGLELELPLEIGLGLNHWLRIPTRILLRLEKFRCRDFPRLFKKASTFPWTQYFLGQIPKIHVTSKRSRLIHTGRIEESMQKALQHHAKGFPASKAWLAQGDSTLPPPELYVDFFQDNCQWSLNTSGESLYFRSQDHRRHVLEAPIRENLAAAILAILLQHCEPRPSNSVLIDPMAGSGVFLKEAHEIGKPLVRTFAYQYFKKQITLPTPVKKVMSPFDQFIYRDISPKAYEAAMYNLESIQRENKLDAQVEDLFLTTEKSFERLKATRYIVVNPPYGIRLSTHNYALSDLLAAILSRYLPEKIAMIIPQEWQKGVSWKKANHLVKKAGYQVEIIRPFQNGGLKVAAVIWKIHRKNAQD